MFGQISRRSPWSPEEHHSVIVQGIFKSRKFVQQWYIQSSYNHCIHRLDRWLDPVPGNYDVCVAKLRDSHKDDMEAVVSCILSHQQVVRKNSLIVTLTVRALCLGKDLV